MTTMLSTPTLQPVSAEAPDSWFRLSVKQYHEMIRHGIIDEDDRVELLEGMLVRKMGQNSPHVLGTQVFIDLFPPMLPPGWFLNVQAPLTTPDSETEPDAALVRGTRRHFAEQGRNPGPADVALVVEVSSSTLANDRGTKRTIYARAGVSEYWIVNLVDRRVEVYTQPSGPIDAPAYGDRRDYLPGDEVPVRLDGVEVGQIRVDDLLV